MYNNAEIICTDTSLFYLNQLQMFNQSSISFINNGKN